jgi:pantetheine-phosphate adenylyltransferase
VKSSIAVYPGTFDPITKGHIDLIKRAGKMYDKVIVAVSESRHKTPAFSLEERIDMVKNATKGMPFVKIESYNGMLVDYLKIGKRRIVIRGLRVISDFEFEFQLALLNKKLDPNVEMIYMMPDEKYLYISSSAIREIAMHDGDLKAFVPENVARALKKHYK